jgi:uncharacterized membrane protein
MTADVLAVVVCFGMAVVTYLTRAGGVFAMSFVPLTRRVQVFLRHMASSVIVAIVVGGAARGDSVANLALATSLAVMVATRQTSLALLVAMGVAAGVRALLPA